MTPAKIFTLAAIATSALITPITRAAPVEVLGTSNPWLAGMPAGSEIDTDAAPAQSPTVITGPAITANAVLSFSVTGAVSNDDQYAPISGPDGGYNVDVYWGNVAHHYTGAANGLSAMLAPFNALVGVFLDDSQPDQFCATPPDLDFSTEASRNFLTLAPLLRQVFFIGDGLTADQIVQQFIVPTGATRLYLAVMDASEWNNNTGSFQVSITPEVTPIPEPATAFALGIPAFALLAARSRRKSRRNGSGAPALPR